MSEPTSQPKGARDSIATIGTVVALVAAMALTLFGLGAAEHAVANYDASSWLWSSPRSEIARVNGATAKVDTRYRIPDASGHAVQLAQTDRYLVLRDQHTGLVSAIDLGTLQIAATTPTTAGRGVGIALHGDSVFVIDAVQGIVRQLDPLTLAPVGDPVRFPPGIGAGTFDGKGLLWIAVPTEGTVVAIRPAPGAANKGGQGGAALAPQEARTLPVAEPNHDLVVSALDDGVAVLDKTTNALTTLRGDTTRTTTLDIPGLGTMPARTDGPDIAVTLVDERKVYIVRGDTVTEFTVPGAGAALKPCVAWSGRFYCPDDATGTIYALSPSGQLLDTIDIRNGPLELEVRERHLFINAPQSQKARVVDEQHRVRIVDKYANNILGGDPPPPPPPIPPQKPAIGKPSAPRSVSASAGNATARVTWGPAAANGAAITRYVVEGGPKPLTTGANQRGVEVTGLGNGQTYRFSVYAVNAKGAGPKRTSNPVVPTSDVPDPPPSVTAKENPNGTVTITWPAANGLGRKIARYTVTAVSATSAAEIGAPTTTSLTTGAGALDYGTQYAFTVVSVNDKGAGSKPSPISNTVVPYTKPGAVKGLAAATVNKPGTVRAAWQPAEDNGRPIIKYVVTANGRTQDSAATAVELGGFGPGENVTVTVKAVNAAGEGPPGTATARTVAPPTITVTNKQAGHTSITLTLSTNANGGGTACAVSVNNSPPAAIACTGGAIGGVWPGNLYSFAITATNVAGTARASDTINTPTLGGRVMCNTPSYCGPQASGGGIWLYSIAHQTPGSAVGDEFDGFRTVARCWRPDTQGSTIVAQPYGGKNSSTWIQVDYGGGRAYIPYAWFRLDAGETSGGPPTAILPRCP